MVVAGVLIRAAACSRPQGMYSALSTPRISYSRSKTVICACPRWSRRRVVHGVSVRRGVRRGRLGGYREGAIPGYYPPTSCLVLPGPNHWLPGPNHWLQGPDTGSRVQIQGPGSDSGSRSDSGSQYTKVSHKSRVSPKSVHEACHSPCFKNPALKA